MHIVIDARIINSTTGLVVSNLLDRLQDIDTENRYTVLVPAGNEDIWEPRAPNFSRLPVDIANHSFAEQTRLYRLLRELAPDVVHHCMPQQPVLPARYKVVTTFYDLTILRIRNPARGLLASLAKRAAGRLVFRRAASRSDKVITMSDYTRRDVIRTLGTAPEKIAVIHGAADTANGPLERYNTPFERYILYVGRQPAYKNIRLLCDAHQQARRKHPDLGLILVGKIDADAQANREYCQTKGYKGVYFTGFLPDSQRDWLYANALGYIFPSTAEGFGLPGLEAMQRGTPVVSSNATCLPEIYGDAALYADPGSTDQFARAITRLADDQTVRENLIRKGHERAAQFSWKRMAQETLALYYEAAAS